jgi:hypothetical protein
MQELLMIMEDSKTLFCSSKFPDAPPRISSQFTDSLGSPIPRLVLGPTGRETPWPHRTFFFVLFKERLNSVTEEIQE